jgi:hypothetical protein
MGRLKFVWALLIVLAAVVVASVSFRYGAQVQRAEENHNLAYAQVQRAEENHNLAYAQAILAFGHYKSYERVESLLAQKCYEAAITDARELKNLQLTLLSRNLHATDNAPELMEYIKLRDPKVLETVVAGRVPEPRTYTTTCP